MRPLLLAPRVVGEGPSACKCATFKKYARKMRQKRKGWEGIDRHPTKKNTAGRKNHYSAQANTRRVQNRVRYENMLYMLFSRLRGGK